jgi:hypothetical protein
MIRTLVFGAAVLCAGAALAQDKGGETRDGIISMDGGTEIFMDPRAPQDRDGIVNMGDGEEIFMDRRSPEDRDGIISMGDGEEI